MTIYRLQPTILSAVLLLAILPFPTLLAAGAASPSPGSLEQSEAQPTTALRLVEADAQGIILELDTPAYHLQSNMIESAPYQSVRVPGLVAGSQAGEPALPVKSTLLGIPAGVSVGVELLEVETAVLPGRYRIAPAPQPVVKEVAGWPVLQGQAFAEEPAVYLEDGLYPADLVQVTATGYVRDQRVARLLMHPFQFNPISGQLLHHRRIKVALRFEGATMPGPEPQIEGNEGYFQTVLADSLLNSEAARAWRPAPETLGFPPATLPENSGPACKIDVEEEGIYDITGAELQAAGCDLESVAPHTLHLYNQGQEVALTVTAGQDGSFGLEDSVRFYGHGLDTKYSSTNVYWLTAESSPGLRIQEVDGRPTDPAPVAEAFTATVHAQQDQVYWAAPTASSGQDYWFWERLSAGQDSPVTGTYSLTLPYVAAGTFSATLRVGLKSRYNEPAYNPDHHLQLYLNDGLVQDASWDGERVQLMAIDLPQSSLVEGANSLQVVLPGDLGVPDKIYVDWFEIDYARRYQAAGDRLAFASDGAGERRFEIGGFTQPAIQLYDITQAITPTRIVSTTAVPVSDTFTLQFQATITAPRHYLALAADQVSSPARIRPDTPSDLRSTSNGADYVIITPAGLATAAQALASHRAGRGHRVAVVDVQDVYDEFSHGLFEPEAIQRFLAYAYAHWQKPRPSYVLLMGDGHLDFHDNLGTGEANLIPPYLGQVDPWLGETASDNRYVAVSGDDILPDMHIGRLPVSSPAEASALVDKIIDYEQEPPPGPWRGQALFVADDADGAGDFALNSDVMAGLLPPSMTVDRVYYGLTHTLASEATEAIVGAINGGRSIVNYAGHGAVPFWAGEGLFGLEDISALTNSARQPLMLPWTCYVGLFDYPGYPSIEESLVRAQGKGAIASWAPSGLGVPAAHEVLATGFYRAVFSDGLRTLGPATTQAKLSLWAGAPGFDELIDTYVLLGDPAMELALPWVFPYRVYLPSVLRGGELP